MSTIAGSTTRHNFIEFDEEETLQSLILDINPISKRKNLLKDARKGWSRLPYQTELFELVNLLWISRKLNIGKMLKMFISKFNIIMVYEDLQNTNVNRDSHLIIINTYSNLNVDITSCLKDTECYALKLSIFKTESKFQQQMKKFWFESNDELLILQCDLITVNVECIKLAKYINTGTSICKRNKGYV